MSSLPPIRLVIADNDPEVLDLLGVDLVAEGFEILASSTQGDEALERCRDLRPDVLVIDFRMPPGPNGVEIAAQASSLDDAPAVIIFTNYRDPSIAARAAKLGVQVIPKGNLRALRRAIRGAAARRS